VPEGQTVNQVYYKEVLTTVREWVIRKRPEMWENGSWILHHDNAPVCQNVSSGAQDLRVGISTLLT
jgi:hypothetical protein